MPWLHVRLDVYDSDIDEDCAEDVRELAGEFAGYVADELPDSVTHEDVRVTVTVEQS